MASTETMTYQDNLHSQYLTNSLSNLSNSRATNQLIVRSYKQATQLYLTKRFKEALETLEPIISGSNPEAEDDNGNGNGHANGNPAPAPIAQSTKGTRTKVWVFYLSLLNSIIEMGQEEGRRVFGATKWRELASQVRDGSVWAEVVSSGYGGNEGEVDADVVANLATLLLGHMQDQRLTQQRLETYLATSDSGGASSSNGHLSFAQDGMSTPMSNSSSSPKALATRLKILELYTLHVLPANGEWEYARSFIEMNDVLDEERKEAFLAALQNLKEEKDGTAQRERELKEQREREMEQQRREAEAEEARRAEAARKEKEREEEEKRKAAEAEKPKPPVTKPANGIARPTPKPTSSHLPPSRPSKPQKKPPSPPPTFYRRASSMLLNLQHLVVQAGQSMNSMAILRLLMFVLAFLLIIARRDLRLKLQRAMEEGWVKLKRTVGMGVK